MAVEVRPLGVSCNLQCRYCYQNSQREAGNVLHDYDLEKLKAAAERIGGEVTLFGGEPLLIPEKDLEALFAWSFAKYGAGGLQTNGTLINENHIRIFRAYNVHVGISLDGPGELNDARWSGTLQKTRADTERAVAVLERLCRDGLSVSLIATLHRGNASADRLPRLHAWLRHLDDLGLKSARLHILEVENESVRQQYGLATDEYCAAFLSFLRLEKELKVLRFDVFDDMRNMLLGKDDDTTCCWNACDPYTTRAVQGIEGNGQKSNCGRTNKHGIDFVTAPRDGYERYLALYHTPQEYGGCQSCRFFLMCKGQCPGTAVGGDWRNRTEHCEIWAALFRHLEAELIAAGQSPISARADRATIEARIVASWASGSRQYMAQILTMMDQEAASACPPDGHGDAHGDFTDFGGRN